jgi:hypothetical protein
MRGHAVASLVPTAILTAMIAGIPAPRRAFAEADPARAADVPAVGQGGATPSPAAGAPVSEVPGPVPPVPRTAEAETAARQPPRMVASLSHDLQFGLALLLGDGYRGIFPYKTMIDCGDAKSNDNRVCTNRAPAFLDVQPSFGLSDRWDFLVDLRLGLTADFNTYHQVYVMPGFRYWLDPQRQVKFFTTIQLAYDRSKQNNQPNVGDNDLGVRNANGLMVEVMRNFGVYVQFGETVGFYRWLSFLVDAGIGIQARVP